MTKQNSRADSHGAWTRSGLSLLWDATSLARLARTKEVASLRELFAMLPAKLPETLPSSKGNALVVAGLESCLDLLGPTESPQWLERDIRQAYLQFQRHYDGQAALIFWLPSGQRRITISTIDNRYYWDRLPIGHLLFGGAEKAAHAIIRDGKPVGVHLRRLS